MSNRYSLIFVLLFLFSNTAFAGDENKLGTLEKEPIYADKLPLTEYVRLYETSKQFYDVKKRYFEEYAFKILIDRLAKEQDIDREEYLRTKLFVSIPPITNKEVEDTINKNRSKYEKYDRDTIRQRIRRSLLEVKKDQKIEQFRATLFNQYSVIFDGAPIEKPNFNIIINANDHSIGPESAKINIVSFFDMECPYCQKMFLTLTNLKDTYGDDLRLTYKHFPLASHRNAYRFAHESECAGQQGRFFEYVQNAFTTENYSRCRTCREEFLEKHDIDENAFFACMEGNQFLNVIHASLNYGRELGITSVPTIFVNGFPIVGNVSKEKLISIIDGEKNEDF